MAIKLTRTQFPDTLGQQAQDRIGKTVDDLSKRDELFASPVAALVSTQAIKAGTSIVVWGGPAGSVLVLPPAASQGKNVGTPLFVLNTTATAVTIAAAAQETVDGGNTVSLAGGQPLVLTSDGATKWMGIGKSIPATRVDVFLTSGTWTNRGGVVSFYGIGNGGGGGSGERAGFRGGASGASGGGYAEATGISASTLPATLAVTIGAVGTGGAAKAVDGPGNNGVDGGDNTVAGVLAALGGKRGLKGDGSIAAPAGGVSVQGSGAGGTGSNVGDGGNAGAGTGRAPGGGGGGAAHVAAAQKGGNGGAGNPMAGVSNAGGVGVIGAVGGNGTSATAGQANGGGGAAGGGNTVPGVAFAGGVAGAYGAGGAGGAGSAPGNNSGAGTAGALGLIIAVTVGPTT